MNKSLVNSSLYLTAIALITLWSYNAQADERIHARGTYGNYSSFGVTDDLPVVVYTASWCDACTELMAFLQQQKVAFKAVDIGKDPAAARLLKAKHLRSLPVIIIKNTLLQGFSKSTVTRKLRELKPGKL
ncbi:glutaredoxin family protein [Thalassomonas actiniarum]|uniref:NrdH-redoxin n=1 Tax=Thalassomonas actiniarum TaxID=485447 RepID=A0AAE9YMY5_9GAMM|nr:glutaredoxin domain-containing protein [Thalassomonas actiniarum]WDD98090.1 NrdH-redoxin [Thalassomonas actiniarum]